LLIGLDAHYGLAADNSLLQQGEAIYSRGVTGSKAPLVGAREQGTHAQGSEAACVNCHHRSGLGTTEGRIVIPPIAGRYLFS